MSGPRVLILGGLGFVGRNLVKHLVDNNLCSAIRVVDKTMAVMVFLAPVHQAAFNSPLVQVMQGDLSNQAAVDKAFAGERFNFVINLAAESKYGQDDAVYQKKILDVARLCGRKALETKVEKFIELSHAGVYEPGKECAERSKLKPWTLQAEYKLKAEEELKAIGVPLVILRPSIIYGVGDVYGIAPRLICARVYVHLGEKMQFLWSKDLRINTVHVDDVCRAIWHACNNLPPSSVFNLSDKGNTTQGSLNSIIEDIFGIKTGFQGMAANSLASVALKTTSQFVNDKHMEPWSEICKTANIANTPLSPYLDYELLHNLPYGINGSAIEATGFTYSVPVMTTDRVREIVETYLSQELFPRW